MGPYSITTYDRWYFFSVFSMIFFVLPFLFAACSEINTQEQHHVQTHVQRVETVPVPPPKPIVPEPTCPSSASVMLEDSKLAPHPTPSKKILTGVSKSTVVDYYHHFFTPPLASFQSLTRQEAHERRLFLLHKLDQENRYISFSTSNTPPNWDGDSKTEYSYEITYWDVSPNRRIIAINKTRTTWVESLSSIQFYAHDEKGIQAISPLQQPWKMSDFTDKDHRTSFPEDLEKHPPVSIRFVENNTWIEVQLAMQEYFELPEIYETFDCLQVQTHPLYFTPTEGLLKKSTQ